LGLSALGLRPAEHDLGLAVPVRKGKAQYSRRYGGTAVQVAAAQRDAAREPQEVPQSRGLTPCRRTRTPPWKKFDRILRSGANHAVLKDGCTARTRCHPSRRPPERGGLLRMRSEFFRRLECEAHLCRSTDGQGLLSSRAPSRSSPSRPSPRWPKTP